MADNRDNDDDQYLIRRGVFSRGSRKSKDSKVSNNYSSTPTDECTRSAKRTNSFNTLSVSPLGNKKMERKISKSEYDLPSLKYELASETDESGFQHVLTKQRGKRTFSIGPISSKICSACLIGTVPLYAPVCRHILDEQGCKHVSIPKLSVDSSNSSVSEYPFEPNVDKKISCKEHENSSSIQDARYESDVPNTTKYTEQEIDRLWQKINKAKQRLLVLQEQQDENVSVYLESVTKNSTESGHQVKSKSQFERSNNKTNATIGAVQKKLDKHYQDIKYLVDSREQSTKAFERSNKLIQVVQDHARQARSRAASFQDNVVEHLESLNNLLRNKKRSMSMGDMEAEVFEKVENSQGAKSTYDVSSSRNHSQSSPTSSEDDVSTKRLYKVCPFPYKEMMSNIVEQLPDNKTIDKSPDDRIDNMCVKLTERIQYLESESSSLRDTFEKIQEMMDMTSKSLQNEQYKINNLERRMREFDEQWNDMTELHQNETSSIREEIERTFECIERIEYRFAEKNSDLGEQIEGCANRLSILEKESEERIFQPYQTTNLKLLAPKFLSVGINIVVGVILLARFMGRVLAYPFTFTRNGTISCTLTLVSIFILWVTMKNNVT